MTEVFVIDGGLHMGDLLRKKERNKARHGWSVCFPYTHRVLKRLKKENPLTYSRPSLVEHWSMQQSCSVQFSNWPEPEGGNGHMLFYFNVMYSLC